ncbi:hypothetical protein GQ43DRAFT_436345 [Delitschia confertaspora ATCC 74209]|uniref:Uncharacterized protein n=1 Tax=Delitschia confertaspora ATCC 74209 TaxID=1513339 RepID=A0A9P4MTE0_9PLEO|nr:hypothetical protein GQ43DRAFT_436345 [Delitschia confertaspora ATCC 74209]
MVWNTRGQGGQSLPTSWKWYGMDSNGNTPERHGVNTATKEPGPRESPGQNRSQSRSWQKPQTYNFAPEEDLNYQAKYGQKEEKEQEYEDETGNNSIDNFHPEEKKPEPRFHCHNCKEKFLLRNKLMNHAPHCSQKKEKKTSATITVNPKSQQLENANLKVRNFSMGNQKQYRVDRFKEAIPSKVGRTITSTAPTGSQGRGYAFKGYTFAVCKGALAPDMECEDIVPDSENTMTLAKGSF